jgi:hypothetical protein
VPAGTPFALSAPFELFRVALRCVATKKAWTLLKEPTMRGHHANRLLMFFAAAAVATAATGCSGKDTSTISTSPSTSSAAAASPTPANPAGANPGPGNGQQNAEVEGRINAGSLAGSCAAHTLSFTVGTTKVVTNASTQFKDARCEALQGNSEVEVKGTRQGDGSILATSVEGDDDDEAENEDRNEAEVKGTIAAGSIGGSCAAGNLSFRVGSTLVKTNASTQFKDAACASLKAGDAVEAKGARQSDGSVLATRVERKK